MLRNKGYIKYEIVTVIVLLLAIFSFSGYLIVQIVNQQRFNVMKKNWIVFSDIVKTNISSFHNSEVVYLQEVIDEGYLANIKNPFDNGFCDTTQSKVSIVDNSNYTTLKCGEYLINEVSNINDVNEIDVFKVTNWVSKKTKGRNVESKVLYNCYINGKPLFSDYLDELFFIYKYNKTFETDYYSIDDINMNNCDIVSKKFYRTIEIVD